MAQVVGLSFRRSWQSPSQISVWQSIEQMDIEDDPDDKISILAERNRGSLVDTLRSPVKVSAATLIGTMPKSEDIVRDGILDKINSRNEWKRVRVALSETLLSFSNPGDDALRDLIPLTEITEIQSRKGIPAALLPTTTAVLSGGQEAEEDAMHVIEISTIQGGYNCGRLCYLRAETAEECRQWKRCITSTADKAVARVRSGHACIRRSQRVLRRFYKSAWLQSFVAIVIVLGFVINIVQTELQLPPGSEAQQRADDFFAWSEVALTSFFALELVLNLASHWLLPFLRDAWNIFDVVVIAISLVSLGPNNIPGVIALRLVRTLRVMRLFGRMSSLRKIVTALSASVLPVASAFCILGVVMAIFAIVGYDLFSDRAPIEFGTFSRSLFTMFQVCTGDAWASEIARPLFLGETEEVVYAWAPVFFVIFIVVVAWTLLQVVVAVLLDNFMAAAAMEEERIRAEKIEKHGKGVQGSVLDPLLGIMANFESLEDLKKRISEIFQILDVDESKALNFEELHDGFRKMTLKSGINFLPDDFEDFTCNGRLCNSRKEIEMREFEIAMRRQLTRFVQNQMAKAMRMTDVAQMLMMNAEDAAIAAASNFSEIPAIPLTAGCDTCRKFVKSSMKASAECATISECLHNDNCSMKGNVSSHHNQFDPQSEMEFSLKNRHRTMGADKSCTDSSLKNDINVWKSDILTKIESLRDEISFIRKDTGMMTSVMEEMQFEIKHLSQLTERSEEKLDCIMSYISDDFRSRIQAAETTTANAKPLPNQLTPPDSPSQTPRTSRLSSSNSNQSDTEVSSVPQPRFSIADGSSFSYVASHNKLLISRSLPRI